MRKVLTIAASEFQTAVRAKGFWIGILFMPVLFGVGLQLQKIVDRQVDARPRTIAIIDDTGELAPSLLLAVQAWNRGERDQGPAVTGGPQFKVEMARPDGRDRETLRLELSERVRREELFAFAELPGELLAPDTTARIR
jgi:hypothetical protein